MPIKVTEKQIQWSETDAVVHVVVPLKGERQSPLAPGLSKVYQCLCYFFLSVSAPLLRRPVAPAVSS